MDVSFTPESSNPKQSFPDELAELRAQIASLTSRVAVLEQGQARQVFVPAVVKSEETSGLGLTVVNRIGVVTLALGILFFFRYAAENNWIGPVACVLLGICAGLAFLGFAEYLNRRKQAVLSQGVAGCGIAILYIACYAASAYYKLLMHGASLMLLLCTCATGMFLGVRYKAQILTGFAVGLAFFALPLMRTQAYAGLSFLCLLITAGGSIWVAVNRKWAVLIPYSAVAGILSALAIEAAASWFVLYCVLLGLLLWGMRMRAGSPVRVANSLYVAGHGCLLVAGLRWIVVEAPEVSVALTAASVLLAIYGIVLLALGVSRNASVDRVTGLSLLGLVTAKLYFYDVWQLKYGFRIIAFVVLGVLLLLASFVYSRYKARG